MTPDFSCNIFPFVFFVVIVLANISFISMINIVEQKWDFNFESFRWEKAFMDLHFLRYSFCH